MQKHCGGITISKSDAERFCALLSETNLPQEEIATLPWDRIADLAERHLLSPLLYSRIKKTGLKIEPEIEDKLHDYYINAAKRNLILFHELDNILYELTKRDITVVIVKGAWLATQVYENKALRQMGDVDLWIRKSQLESAREALAALGYRINAPKDRPQPLQDAYGGETKLFKAHVPLVELHWRIFSGEWLRCCARIDEDSIWKRSLALKGETVRQLRTEDAVIHLCVHLAVNHQMSLMALRTLFDLDLLRRKHSVDWARVAGQATEWGVSRPTWLVLSALKEVFGDPDGVLPLVELQPPMWSSLIIKRAASAKAIVQGADFFRGYRKYIYLLALADNPSRALMLFFRALFPERRWLALRYGLKETQISKIMVKRLLHPFLAFTNRRI
jgi:hypothetical protein